MTDYRLVVLTHGPDGPRLVERAIQSFSEHVTPAPAHVVVCYDGTWPGVLKVGIPDALICVTGNVNQAGFCAATGRAWQEATESGTDWVFWLEHDFTFNRPVSLVALSRPLRANPALAQMALRRQPVSPEEVAAGGYVQLRPDTYRQVWSAGLGTWLEHSNHFTTNPSLMRREFMAENLWLDPAVVPSECEGRYGIGLREKGYRFGLWGGLDDLPWVTHDGARTGTGY